VPPEETAQAGGKEKIFKKSILLSWRIKCYHILLALFWWHAMGTIQDYGKVSTVCASLPNPKHYNVI
jgi:hypothetical protein